MISKTDLFRNDFEKIKLWAESNDPNKAFDKGTPLGLASFEGKIKTVKMLVKNGANPNFTGPDLWTPLIFAANDCRVNVIKYLLSIGADVNLADSRGQTPLHHLCFCARKENTVAAYELIHAGVDVQAKNTDGKTAYELAEDNKSHIRNYEIFREMIQP